MSPTAHQIGNWCVGGDNLADPAHLCFYNVFFGGGGGGRGGCIGEDCNYLYHTVVEYFIFFLHGCNVNIIVHQVHRHGAELLLGKVLET